jgi:hypothetical protein
MCSVEFHLRFTHSAYYLEGTAVSGKSVRHSQERLVVQTKVNFGGPNSTGRDQDEQADAVHIAKDAIGRV